MTRRRVAAERAQLAGRDLERSLEARERERYRLAPLESTNQRGGSSSAARPSSVARL